MYDDVLLKAGDELCIETMRLPRGAIEELCHTLRAELQPEVAYVRTQIPLLKRVCVALYVLASCCECRVAAEQFGVSKVSVFRCVNAFCVAMTVHHQQYITFPSQEEAVAIAERIEHRHKYPQAFAALECSHIAITPSTGHSDYLNRKMHPSIVLQGLVDDKYLFRDVSCKCPGSLHDSAVFQNSSLFERLARAMPVYNRIIDGVSVPLNILGDPAYPLTSKVIKTYVGRNLAPAQASFNVYHSSARMVVENAFGRLKSRWRMVAKRLECKPQLAPFVIMTYCCLHNICEKLKTPMPAAHQDIAAFNVSVE